MNCLRKVVNNNILIVDDEEDVLDFLRIFLESLGWTVTPAPSVHVALENLTGTSFFLVLTDIAMPEMDGYEFVSTIRDKNLPSEVALMTGFGYNPKHTLVKIKKIMRCPFYFKPFNRLKLAAGVRDAWVYYHKEIYFASQSS
ncbi:MAG: response regulator [Chitinivibrionales bacterium]|nr:response regulator [Chitinivibrionales bacterium]